MNYKSMQLLYDMHKVIHIFHDSISINSAFISNGTQKI